MDILFLCGSAQAGKDGVGDYTRRLCGKLIRSGHKAQILSLCDQHVISFTTENQEIEETIVVVHRIPLSAENEQRLIWSQRVVRELEPDWISLQFVPYSFNPKGLPFWLSSFLKKIKGNHKWHIMLHELWVGMDLNDTYKSKCIGLLQKNLILKILKFKKEVALSTQTDVYHYKITELGYNAQLLPLFSNIIKNVESDLETAKDDLELRFCIFGNIHHGAPVEKFLNDLKLALSLSEKKKRVKFFFIGNCGSAIAEWEKVLLEHHIDVDIEITGFATDSDISDLLLKCQYGISTTPYLLNQKSGSLAAMFEHQLPVLCIARNWRTKNFRQKKFLNLTEYENQASIIKFISTKFIASDENSLESVALKFVEGLK